MASKFEAMKAALENCVAFIKDAHILEAQWHWQPIEEAEAALAMPDDEPVAEITDDGKLKLLNVSRLDYGSKLYTMPQPANVSALPVAWMCEYQLDGETIIEYSGHNEFSNGRTGTPLYTAPQPPAYDEAREQAAYQEWFESQQGIAYEGAWSVAQAAWLHRAAMREGK